MFEKFNEQFAALSDREKYLVLLTGVILIVFAGFTFVIEPKYLENDRIDLETENKRIELRGSDQQLVLLKEALADDPNEQLQQRINNLHQRIEALDQEFATQMRELVPAQQMPIVIDQMLQQAHALKLQELSSIPPVSVYENDEQRADLPLYQHGVKFVFEGGYAQVLNYLESVEAFPWQVYWRSLDYQVDEYPNATITLELYTLSTNRAFMGVQ
jgi:MSHA biogenesis protein MshJ